MICELDKNYNFKSIEEEINKYWIDYDIYIKTRNLKKEKKPFFFVDGPPYTTGNIHLGTAWNKIMKDSIIRFLSMSNHNIIDKPGWDMHGLPIEVKVEEKLGFKSKKDIEKFGISNFIDECLKFSLMNQKSMTNQFKKLGIWMNWDNPYMTIDDKYIESSWWVIKRIYENNLLYKGKRVVNWCPRCETAIADSEVEYDNKEDDSIYLKFKIKNEYNTYIVIWTTTPWTIPANVAIAVNPKYEYAKIKVRNKVLQNEEYLYILKDQIDLIISEGNYQKEYTIVNTLYGKDLENIEYDLKIDSSYEDKITRKIILADYVSKENTGCVHIAPGHGIDDFNIGIKYKLPVICIIDSDGISNHKHYSKLTIPELNNLIINNLSKMKLLISNKKIIHRYGHCWRCKKPIIYRATEQWFIKVSELKEKLLDKIKDIIWYPEWAGSSRFNDWIKEARDWCISRQRYWGIPIPIWTCSNCNNIDVIGTKEELIKKAKVEGLSNLHRQNVDNLKIECKKCSSKMERISDIFDVWFDSSVASFATLEYPQKSYLFEKIWPADLILEGHDQTRGWFYSQLCSSVASINEKPYKNVVMHGFTLDSIGKKMSKSIGNVISPIELVNEFGADVLRLYVLSSNSPWDDLKYSNDEIKTIYRFVNILWNVCKFPIPYMLLDNYIPSIDSIEQSLKNMNPEDKWILSMLNSLISNVSKSMKEYNIHKAVRFISNFILEDLSRWYIQLIRERVWTEKNTKDKYNVYSCLYYSYYIIILLLAPFAPYITEKIYLSMFKNSITEMESIHMLDWPLCNELLIDSKLEYQMEIIKEIVEIVSNGRQKIGRKLRWPIKMILIAPNNDNILNSIKTLKHVLLDQSNSKQIIILNENEIWKDSLVHVKPLQSELGPIFKNDSKKIYDFLESLNGMELINKFKSFDTISLKLNNGTDISINKNMISFEEETPKDTLLIYNNNIGKVYLDCRLDEEIISEGYSREIIRRIQDMRKELKLNVDDSINVIIFCENESVLSLLKNKLSVISNETRSVSCTLSNTLKKEDEYRNKSIINPLLIKSWDIESYKFKIIILK